MEKQNVDVGISPIWDGTHTQAEVKQEEHVECHVDLQSVVFVEVLAGLNGPVRHKKQRVIFPRINTEWSR